MIIRRLSEKEREIAVYWILGISQLSFFTSRILTHFAGEQLAFLIGVLTGFSIVGNLFCLWEFGHKKRSST